MWFIGVEVEQETRAPPPKKNPGSAPENELDCRDAAPLIRKFIHGSEAEGNKLNKRNELLITESQCDFFCFIPSAWVKNSKLANTKMTSSAYLPCFANAGAEE